MLVVLNFSENEATGRSSFILHALVVLDAVPRATLQWFKELNKPGIEAPLLCAQL